MAATKAAKYTKELAEHFYETMCTIRKFEESVKHDFLNGEIPGFVHLYIGEEAIATGVCSALRKDDMIESTHRRHGHCVAKGADVNRMRLEIFGKKTGLCRPRRLHAHCRLLCGYAGRQRRRGRRLQPGHRRCPGQPR